MYYAVIPKRNEDQITWIFETPVNTSPLMRVEDNGALQCYLILKGLQFSKEQSDVIESLEGIIFSNQESLINWRLQNGDADVGLAW